VVDVWRGLIANLPNHVLALDFDLVLYFMEVKRAVVWHNVEFDLR